MLSNWLARVGSAIPRGFSRHYILGLLEEEPMTGKEIIDRAILQSGGKMETVTWSNISNVREAFRRRPYKRD